MCGNLIGGNSPPSEGRTSYSDETRKFNIVMEIKDLPGSKAAAGIKSQDKQRSIKSLEAAHPLAKAVDPVSVQLEHAQHRENVDVSRKANEVISVVNQVSDATKEIKQLVESLGGITEQADQNQGNPKRVAALEKEANDLVDEIKKRVNAKTEGGVDLFGGDKIRLDVEKQLGKVLDVILPDDKVGSGISEVKFTPKDLILNVRTNIEKVRARLETVSDSLNSTKGEVESVIKELAVANENSEASNASVRDVDQALELADKLRGSFAARHQQAVNASGVTPESLKLLN